MRLVEPTIITAGESIEWLRTFDDYPASEWTLAYRFRGQNGPGFDVAATANGDGHDVSVPTTVTVSLTEGRYLWQAWATNIADSSIVKMIASGFCVVKAGHDVSSQAAVDTRSANRRIYDAILDTIANRATSAQQEYEISTPAGTNKLKYVAFKDLLDARDKFAKLVASEDARERARRGGKFGKAVKVRMTTR